MFYLDEASFAKIVGHLKAARETRQMEGAQSSERLFRRRQLNQSPLTGISELAEIKATRRNAQQSILRYS